MKKFEFTGENKVWCGYTLRRIRALVDIPTHCVKKGDLGGWIEKDKNLSHDGNARVSGNTVVCDAGRAKRIPAYLRNKQD